MPTRTVSREANGWEEEVFPEGKAAGSEDK